MVRPAQPSRRATDNTTPGTATAAAVCRSATVTRTGTTASADVAANSALVRGAASADT
ncbi:hypothetical protein [Dactylosporangium sp. CA-092794]|uniref:hypothetical protein n=1 Tax=Dactylosporangium sp. CA-092794 TaxID=3239929 RepID=UPI003D8E6A99